MKLSIIVPCYNEEESIGQVLRQLEMLQLPCDVEVIVVDDGSTDSSATVIQGFSNLRFIRHRINKGKGAVIREGVENSSGDMILIQDADLEYCPSDIPKLLKPILMHEADVVLGSRMMGKPKRMSRSHLIANKFLSCATRVLFGSATTDLMTGYKLFTRSALEQVTIDSEGFEVEAELVGKFLVRGLRVVEVPIKYEYRRKGKAKIGWRHGLGSLWTLLKVRVSAI